MPDPVAHNHDQRYYPRSEADAVVQAAIAAYTPTSSLAAIATSGSASDLIIGTLANARLSPQVVRSDFSYPDPSWVTSISAGKLTGLIDDARLSSNVPLKNANNVFSVSQIFDGSLVIGGVSGSRIKLGTGQAILFNNNADNARVGIQVGTINASGVSALDGGVSVSNDLYVRSNTIVRGVDFVDRIWLLGDSGRVVATDSMMVGGLAGPQMDTSAGVIRFMNNAKSGWWPIAAGAATFNGVVSVASNNTIIGNTDSANTLGGLTYFRPAVGGASGALISGSGQAWMGSLSIGGGLEAVAPTNGLLVAGAVNIQGAAQFGSTLSVTGVLTASSGLAVSSGGASITGGLTVNGSTILNGNVSAGFNAINANVYNANGTTYSGIYEWRRNNVRHAYMGYDATNDVTLNLESGGKFVVTTSMQVGFNGPILRNSSGAFWVVNATNTGWADAFMGSVQAGQYKAMSGDYIQTAGATGTPWTFLTNAAGALGIKVGNLVVSNSYSDIAPTNGLFVKGNTQIVGALTLAADLWHGDSTNPERLYFATNAGTAYMGYGATPHLWRNNMSTDIMWLSSGGNLTVTGHITSSFQILSSDPSTLDISSGAHRLVKNTTSGEIRNWVNDAGVMKKSPAYV